MLAIHCLKRMFILLVLFQCGLNFLNANALFINKFRQNFFDLSKRQIESELLM